MCMLCRNTFRPPKDMLWFSVSWYNTIKSMQKFSFIFYIRITAAFYCWEWCFRITEMQLNFKRVFFQITFATFQISALSSKMVDRNYLLTFLMQINAFPHHVRYNSLKAIQLIVAILIKLNYVWKKIKCIQL